MNQIINTKFMISKEERELGIYGGEGVLSLKKQDREQQLMTEVSKLRSQDTRNCYYHKGEWKERKVNDDTYCYSLSYYSFLTSLEDALVGEFVWLIDRVIPPSQGGVLHIAVKDEDERVFEKVGTKDPVWKRVS